MAIDLSSVQRPKIMHKEDAIWQKVGTKLYKLCCIVRIETSQQQQSIYVCYDTSPTLADSTTSLHRHQLVHSTGKICIYIKIYMKIYNFTFSSLIYIIVTMRTWWNWIFTLLFRHYSSHMWLHLELGKWMVMHAVVLLTLSLQDWPKLPPLLFYSV